jgi:hypothetical protein
MMGNFEAVVFFAVVAYLSTFFTKNMVIVFLISILATNFLMVSRVNYFSRMNAREGMQTKDAEAKDAEAKDAEAKDAETTDAESKDAEANAKDAQAAANVNVATKSSAASATAAASNADAPKPTPTNSKKTSGEKEGMNGKLAPAKFNDDSDDEGTASSPFPGTTAQRNAQMERAHDSLQNIGSGAMKMQTAEVIQQQKVLMDNIKTMQPFLETAERFLDKFNMKGIDGLLGKIGMGGGAAAATPGPSS